MTPAGHDHGRIANKVAYWLTDHVRRRALGRVYAAETGFVLHRHPDTVLASDVSFVAMDRARGAGPEVF